MTKAPAGIPGFAGAILGILSTIFTIALLVYFDKIQIAIDNFYSYVAFVIVFLALVVSFFIINCFRAAPHLYSEQQKKIDSLAEQMLSKQNNLYIRDKLSEFMIEGKKLMNLCDEETKPPPNDEVTLWENNIIKFYNYFFPKNPDDDKIKENKHKSRTYLLTIQILFSIIIGISFIDYQKELVPFNWNFETAMIFVAYATVLLSLIGYSIAVKYRYHRNFLRFGLDLFLLYLYYQLVYGLQNSFDYFLFIFPIIFGVYVIWQFLEYVEWRRDDGNDKYKRKEFLILFFGTLTFFAIFLAIFLFYDGTSMNVNKGTDLVLNYRPVTDLEINILGLIIILLFTFRVFVAHVMSKLK